MLDAHCADLGRNPGEITRSVHLAWAADNDPGALAERAAEFVAVGANQVIFSMCAPYRATVLEPLAHALTANQT